LQCWLAPPHNHIFVWLAVRFLVFFFRFLTFFTVLARQDVDVMDELCAQTRVQLKEDPNAMEFFNSFSSAENIGMCDDIKRQVREGYGPGGHRISALRESLAGAGELLAVAFSNSFFAHIARPAIGNTAAVMPVEWPHTYIAVRVCCRAFLPFGLHDEQVEILAMCEVSCLSYYAS
jgi:hypothetical protein